MTLAQLLVSLHSENTDLLLIFKVLLLAQLSDHLCVDYHLETLGVDLVLLQTGFEYLVHLCKIALQLAFCNFEIRFPPTSLLHKICVI